MAYVSQSISNYNDNAPSDDGSAVATNQIKWSIVKDELADPIKTLAENINSAVSTAFTQLFLSNTDQKATTFTVSATNDDGKFFDCTAALTVNLPAAADAGDGFKIVVYNNSSNNTITIDGNSSETINGSTTVTLTQDDTYYVLICDGSAWYGVYWAGDSITGDRDYSGNNTYIGKTAYKDAGELTIATGAITVTGSNHTIDTQGDASTDDLDTINGGADGQILVIRAENTARTVVVKDGTGNIETDDGTDITLDNTEKSVVLIYDDALSKWLVLSRPTKSIIQIVSTSTGAVSTGTTTIPIDDTIPQNTEGDEYMTLAITPLSSSSTLVIEVVFNYSQTGATSNTTLALFQDSTADALAATFQTQVASTEPNQLVLRHVMTSGTTSETTFKVRAGDDASETLTFNGVSGGRIFGGVMASSITITEIL